MPETPSFNPDSRDRMSHDKSPLLAAADRLARAVAELEPDEEYAPTPPQALIVGGFVRDLHLGLKPKDADIEVSGVSAERLEELLRSLFGTVDDIGKSFGVFKVKIGDRLELDVSLPRLDSKSGAGHKGIQANVDPSLGIKDAARRRDFTMNAMTMDPITGVIYDPYGGTEDLDQKILRAPDLGKFEEDPLRVMRAVQFAARMGFSVDPKLEDLMRKIVADGILSELPPERITDEMEKLLMKALRPSVGLALAESIGVFEKTFPELGLGVDRERIFGAADAAAGIIRDAKFGLSETERREVMLAALVAGLSRNEAHSLFGRLTFYQQDIKSVLAVAENYREAGGLRKARESGDKRAYVNEVRKRLKKLGNASWHLAFAMSEIDDPGHSDMFAQTVIENRFDAEGAKPLLDGQDLQTNFGLKPGKQLGETMALVEFERDAGTIVTKDDAIAYVRSMMKP